MSYSYDFSMRRKAHIYSAHTASPLCETCGLARTAECHAFYSYLETPANPVPSLPFAVITIMYQPGVGTQRKVSNREELDAFIDECIKNNTPFHVGHEFGNIDGTHPKR